MGKPSDHGVTWSPFAAAAPAPLVGLDHLAGQYGTIRLESLPGDNEAEFVEAAEGSQVGAGERISAPADGSVVHVEVFRAECVGALILGRPRPLSGHRRAGPPRDVRYTLIWEEPAMVTDRYQHVRHHPTVAEFTAWAQEAGLEVIGVDIFPDSEQLETYDLPRNCVLVFGQEGPGLSDEVHAAATTTLSIEQFGSTRSINAASAAAIAMHAWIRRHAFGQVLR